MILGVRFLIRSSFRITEELLKTHMYSWEPAESVSVEGESVVEVGGQESAFLTRPMGDFDSQPVLRTIA